MNKIEAVISKIDNIENLNIVYFKVNDLDFKMMSLDLKDEIKVGTKVLLKVKTTHVSIAKNVIGDLSFSNQFDAKVIDVNNGELLSIITLKVYENNIQSLITKDSSIRMNLKENDLVRVLIKASDISISEIINE